MNYKLLVETAVHAGEIMLCNGAETYRVEDTMYHILKSSELETVETLVLMTGIMATLSGEGIEPITVIRRVNNRGTNLNKIMHVNEISRQLCGGDITLEKASQALKNIEGKQYSIWLYNLATIAVVVGFCMFFAGSFIDIMASCVSGIFLSLLITIGKKIGINIVILDIITASGIGFITIFMKQFISAINIDIVIISSIMPLVPGVAITNAIRDTLQGDYISGTAKCMEAFLKAAAIALGMGISLALFGRMFVGRGIL